MGSRHTIKHARVCNRRSRGMFHGATRITMMYWIEILVVTTLNLEQTQKTSMSHAELDSRDMRSLNQLREESKALEKELMQLEQQLYNFEGSYLEETWPTGNVVRGFEGYVVNKNKKGADAVVTRKTKFKDTERIFSYSSESSTRVRCLS